MVRAGTALVVLLGAAAWSGCYLSHERPPFDGGPDAPADALIPDAPDAPAPPACVHRRTGEAQLTAFVDHGARSPDLVWTSEGLSTVFLESDGSLPHPFVSLVFTREDLGGATPPGLVGEESHSWAEALALDDGSLAIAWLSDPGLVSRTALRRIDPRGRPFGDRLDVDFDGGTCLDLARAGALVAVAYRGIEGGAAVAYLAFVDPVAGGRRSERFLLGPDDVSPQLASLDGERVLAVLPGETGVTLREYEPTGPGRTLVVPVDRPVGRTVAAVGDGVILLAMQVGEAGARGLRVRRVDPSLSRYWEPFEIVPEGHGVLGVRLIATHLGYTLSWGETVGELGEGRFMVAHLGSDGRPLEARRVVFSGQLGSFAGPGLASIGEQTWVASSRPIDGRGHAQLFLAGYECERRSGCDAMDARAPDGPCGETTLLGYRWDGARCVRLDACLPCAGDDCDALAATPAECEIDHSACP